MKLDEEGTRYTLAATLMLVAAVIAVAVWFIDPFSMQRVFGAMMGTELVAFAMVTYIVYKPNLAGVSRTWLLIGCATMAVFLFLAIGVAGE